MKKENGDGTDVRGRETISVQYVDIQPPPTGGLAIYRRGCARRCFCGKTCTIQMQEVPQNVLASYIQLRLCVFFLFVFAFFTPRVMDPVISAVWQGRDAGLGFEGGVNSGTYPIEGVRRRARRQLVVDHRVSEGGERVVVLLLLHLQLLLRRTSGSVHGDGRARVLVEGDGRGKGQIVVDLERASRRVLRLVHVQVQVHLLGRLRGAWGACKHLRLLHTVQHWGRLPQRVDHVLRHEHAGFLRCRRLVLRLRVRVLDHRNDVRLALRLGLFGFRLGLRRQLAGRWRGRLHDDWGRGRRRRRRFLLGRRPPDFQGVASEEPELGLYVPVHGLVLREVEVVPSCVVVGCRHVGGDLVHLQRLRAVPGPE
eukprot:Rhum_TRINITY_DN8921_c0_g1::Rhum_TRINITY_DN8921_c0_g1_i1::g.30644::m.30644